MALGDSCSVVYLQYFNFFLISFLSLTFVWEKFFITTLNKNFIFFLLLAIENNIIVCYNNVVIKYMQPCAVLL